MSLILYGVLNGCLYGLWSVSFSLIYRPTKIFHVVHAAAFTLAAYAFWIVISRFGPVVSALIAVALGTTVGIVSELYLYRPLRRWGTSPVLLFVASLGAYIVLENIIQLTWGAEPRTATVDALQALDRTVKVFGASVSLLEVAEAGVSILLWVASLALLRWTLIGKAMRAVAVSPEMAELAGINVQWVRVVAFGHGSLLISIAGLMALTKSGIEPTAGLPVWIIAVIATLITGASPVGSFLAGLAIGFSEAIILVWLPSKWQPLVPVLVLLGYLIALSAGRVYASWFAIRAAKRNVARVGIRL